MASPTVQIGTGAEIVFGTSGFAAEIVGFNHDGIERAVIDTTHLATTNARTKTPGDLYDPGELSLEVHFNPDALPPINAAAETITITFNSGATWAFSGFGSGFTYGNPLEDKLTGTLTVAATGQITPTPAA